MANEQHSIIAENNIKADWLTGTAIKMVFSLFEYDGDLVRVVGGAPRDHMLGRKVRDIDLASPLLPEEIIKRAENANITVIPTGVAFGTVTLIVNEIPFEITTLRRDVQTDGRHAIVKFGTDWRKDAERRDFTINALYISPDGKLHDPLGQAINDLRERRLRFIGAADQRICEDYLRTLRFYRFAAELSISDLDKEALSATSRNRAGLRQLSSERIGSEMIKLLGADDPLTALRAMYRYGLLTDILKTVPKLETLNKLLESENTLSHQLEPIERLAALALWQRADAARLSARFRLSNKQQHHLKTLSHAFSFPAFSDQQSMLKWLYKEGAQTFIALLMLASAFKGGAATYDELQAMINWTSKKTFPPFPISGKVLLNAGMTPGPEIGKLLKKLEDEWLESDMSLTEKELLQRAGL